MGFNYPYTCPEIDSGIMAVHSDVTDALLEAIEEVCPRLAAKDAQSVADDVLDRYKLRLATFFEDVRTCNEKLRDAACDQVEALEERIAELEMKLKELEGEA